MSTQLPIVGRRVSSVAFSFVSPYVVLHLPAWTIDGAAEATDYVLQVDGPISLGGAEINLESGPHEQLLGLVGRFVSAAETSDRGSLRVEFTEGDTLTIEPHAYEPWQLYGSDGSEVISRAGGGIDSRGVRVGADTRGRTERFEYEVAEVHTLPRRGTFAIGWIRSGTVRVGDKVVVGNDATAPSTIRGIGMLSGPGQRAGGPSIELLLDELGTGRLAPGIRIRSWRDSVN